MEGEEREKGKGKKDERIHFGQLAILCDLGSTGELSLWMTLKLLWSFQFYSLLGLTQPFMKKAK